MKKKLLYRNFYIVLSVDVLLIASSFYIAYLVRFEFEIPPYFFENLMRVFPYVLIGKIGSFYFFDLYRGMWRYTSIADLFNILKSSIISTLLIICFVLLRYHFIGFSRSVFLMDWCFTILFVSGFRLGVRLYFETTNGHRSWSNAARSFRSFLSPIRKKIPGSKNLLIIGAGDCGEKIYREIRDNANLQYQVVGFLDDNPAKIGKKIHGIPVLSEIKDIQAVAERVNAHEALIAIPSATVQHMRRIIEHCNDSGIDFKIIPGYGELINGRLSISSIREVTYPDLIGREIIKLDVEKIGGYLKAQHVLVTGAGGSIGAELCRQICRFRPQSIILFERAETPLYEIELDLKPFLSDINIVSVLGDIQDKKQLNMAFEKYHPNIVFHAAAYKHVPMLELQPWKAVDNNILGTQNLVDVASEHEIERFVFVSTDKAVRPTNVMGASKHVAEMLIQGQNSCNVSKTQFMIVRFGNVVGSVGSVVPLFKKQIARGGPVTVTHPDVARYFMTIPEACQLILQAGAMGEGGEIFILDMGTPIRIADMAKDLIRLSGFEPEVDIQIEYIGLRPGEKLYEELITEGEGIIQTSHEKILVLKGVECNLEILTEQIHELTTSALDQNSDGIIMKLQEIVPEYRPTEHENKPHRFAINTERVRKISPVHRI